MVRESRIDRKRELPGVSYIELTITEALMVHPATEYVKDFEFSHDGDGTWVSFVVKGYPWEEEERLSIRVGGEKDGV